MREDMEREGRVLSIQEGKVGMVSRSSCPVCGQEVPVGLRFRLVEGRAVCVIHTSSLSRGFNGADSCSCPADRGEDQDGKR